MILKIKIIDFDLFGDDEKHLKAFSCINRWVRKYYTKDYKYDYDNNIGCDFICCFNITDEMYNNINNRIKRSNIDCIILTLLD